MMNDKELKEFGDKFTKYFWDDIQRRYLDNDDMTLPFSIEIECGIVSTYGIYKYVELMEKIFG